MKKISVIGSTGSIGTQTLDVVKNFPDEFKVVGLTANSNFCLLERQIREFSPEVVSIGTEEGFNYLKSLDLSGVEILKNSENVVASYDNADMVVISTVGISGLFPAVLAIKAKKEVALATKEALVTAGSFVSELAFQNNVTIRPIDSEHSAIWQSIGRDRKFLKKIILTCSGGALRDFPDDKIYNASVEDVLKHPNWNMGRKITVDSATLMNKGFEVIEAYHLFSVGLDDIQVVIHPQSVVHSMVEFCDGSVIAQLAVPNMRLAIQYAMSYPERFNLDYGRLDFSKISTLTFAEPDTKKFPCLLLAYEALKTGKSMPCALNAANEIAVAGFLEGKIPFGKIYEVIEKVLCAHKVIDIKTLDDVVFIDRISRERAKELVTSFAD